MKLTELLQSNRPTVSCELFPPKPGTALLDAPSVVRRMAALHPAYMSVTWQRRRQRQRRRHHRRHGQ